MGDPSGATLDPPENAFRDPPLPELELALHLDPRDLTALRAVPELRRARGSRASQTSLSIVWYDTAEGHLAARGLAVEELREGPVVTWRLKRTRCTPEATWVCGTPGTVLAQGADAAALGQDWPGRLLPVAAFQGTGAASRIGPDGQQTVVTVEQGLLRAIAAEQRICRLLLRGPPEQVLEMAMAAARAARASIPARSLADDAIRLARPQTRVARSVPPLLNEAMAIGDAFAHVVAQITATMLAMAPGAAAREGSEPVHQMRVAVRRLRSAMSLFQRAMLCPELDRARDGLRGLGRALGPARDWDVFTEETTARLDAFADDAAVQRLLVAARRRRAASYAVLRAYLEGPEFRVLGVRLAALAALRPWELASRDEAADEEEPRTLGEFAGHQLARLRRKMREGGKEVASLPAADLHALRIRAKRLRYAAEFFAPLFPGKAMARYIRRVSALQQELGVLNDGAVTAKLVAELARAPGYAAGVVAGDVAARAGDARARIAAAWRKLDHAAPGWKT